MGSESEVIRREMLARRAALVDKLEQLELKLTHRIDGVKETVDQSVGAVYHTVDAVKSGAASVKEACDVTRHVDRRPWTMVGVAATLGFVTGIMLRKRAMRHAAFLRMRLPATAAPNGNGTSAVAAAMGQPAPRPDAASAPMSVGEIANLQPSAPSESRSSRLAVIFHDEILQLRGLAIGMLFGIIRDVVAGSVSKPIGRQVESVMDGVTLRFGGKPISGHVLNEHRPADRGAGPSPDSPDVSSTQMP